MERDFWHERWEQGQIRFNQPVPNPLLVEHWAAVAGPVDRPVFVPLAGKSIDMVWLADQGHHVIGNELSPLALEQFVAEHGLTPQRRTERGFEVLTAGPYELWCGDLFELQAADLAAVGAIYDRASLVALPPAMRRRYADHLTAVLPADASVLLVAFEYDQAEMDGPPFSVTADEIAELYGARYDIDQVARLDRLESNHDLRSRGLSSLHETATILRPR